MGGLISAPLSAAGTCLGGCFGSCLATSCCKLAGFGTVSSAQASRCILIWLQAFIAILAVFLASTAEKWLPWTCGKLDVVGMGELGICECKSQSNCWFDQMIYRTEASGVAVFLALVVMSVSGCAEGAARSYAVAKFMTVVCLVLISLFLPNTVWTGFGSWATALSAIYLIAQSIVLIDFGYTWNETWYKFALEANRRQVGSKGYRMWLGGMLLASAALALGAVSMSIYLFVDFQDPSSRAVNVCAMILSIVLLVVSITDWCEHGALLTSAVVMAYTIWLICESLAASPHENFKLPTWAGLLLCFFSLFSTVLGAGVGGQETSAPPARAAGLMDVEGGEAGSTATPPEEAGSPRMKSSEAWQFAAYAAIHAAAALYVTSSLAARTGPTTYALRVSAVFVSLVLYGWSLIAPKVLTNRRF
eukprot:CAMPEP_0114649284 /NCGR_PEP_ID=MMETSP0191-20121206/6952_1 /TAXON_ID=126664 /ORGANISM="Sorites sp." /LENGTH=418 /DNA_ID=CAMNT_0001862869 /DNA_START=39 /DNA_END=1295 /DNA_ORIENTATION=+